MIWRNNDMVCANSTCMYYTCVNVCGHRVGKCAVFIFLDAHLQESAAIALANLCKSGLCRKALLAESSLSKVISSSLLVTVVHEYMMKVSKCRVEDQLFVLYLMAGWW